ALASPAWVSCAASRARLSAFPSIMVLFLFFSLPREAVGRVVRRAASNRVGVGWLFGGRKRRRSGAPRSGEPGTHDHRRSWLALIGARPLHPPRSGGEPAPDLIAGGEARSAEPGGGATIV